MRTLQTNRTLRRVSASSAIGVLLTGIVACSGGGDAVKTGTVSTTFSTIAPTTTTEVAATTTTVAATTTTVEATTTTDPGPPVYPLTGLPATDPTIASRVALVVKIDNAPDARPQTGFNEADLVFEEIVNDNLTRFAMIFQSQGSNPVGPIRSGRLQDINIFGSLNHPLFAWSGGNATVTAAIRASDLVDIGPSRVHAYYRDNARKVPHNLYSTTNDLWAQTPFGSLPPQKQFSYRKADEAPAGTPGAGVALALDAVDVRWAWDAATGLYRRTMEGQVHKDAASGQVTANNVVVLVMDYTPGISGSPDAQTTGTGDAYVFTGGNTVHATWSRATRTDPFVLTGDDGKAIGLTPGRTFIELPRAGHTLPLPAA